MYDFQVYGYLATFVANDFFPSNRTNMALIEAFGTYSAAFLMRPLGGLFFGRIGDKVRGVATENKHLSEYSGDLSLVACSMKHVHLIGGVTT